MNLPFKFAAATATAVLVLNDETTNLILNGIKTSGLTEAQKARFGLLAQPLTPGWLYTVSVSADKDCTIIFGCYDTSNTTFYGVYPVELLASGGNEHTYQFNTGLPLPLGGSVVPALQVVVGTTVILCGHVEIIPSFGDRDATPINPAPLDPAIE
jgi:hypothetical protein